MNANRIKCNWVDCKWLPGPGEWDVDQEGVAVAQVAQGLGAGGVAEVAGVVEEGEAPVVEELVLVALLARQRRVARLVAQHLVEHNKAILLFLWSGSLNSGEQWRNVLFFRDGGKKIAKKGCIFY